MFSFYHIESLPEIDDGDDKNNKSENDFEIEVTIFAFNRRFFSYTLILFHFYAISFADAENYQFP